MPTEHMAAEWLILPIYNRGLGEKKMQGLLSGPIQHWGWCLFTEKCILCKEEASSLLFVEFVRFPSGDLARCCISLLQKNAFSYKIRLFHRQEHVLRQFQATEAD